MGVSQYTGEPCDAGRVLPAKGAAPHPWKWGRYQCADPFSPLLLSCGGIFLHPGHLVTGIGVLIRQGWQCRVCDAPIRLSTAWYQNVIPLTDPYWERSKTPLAFRKSPLRAYCRTCRPEGSRLRRTSLTKKLPTVADLKPPAAEKKNGGGQRTGCPPGNSLSRESGSAEMGV